MEVKGTKREKVTFEREMYVGLTNVRVVAINPTRAEVEELIGRKIEKEGDEYQYTDEKDGVQRVQLVFWLKDVDTARLYTHKIYLTENIRQDQTKTKTQIINSTCDTTYIPHDAKGNIKEDLIPKWWLSFTDKDDKNKVIGEKTWKYAHEGEEAVGTLLRSWLGDLNWYDPSAEVFLDVDELLDGNVSGLRKLIGSGYDTPFTILMGVSTSKDGDKKYQEIYKKQYLPTYILDTFKEGRALSTRGKAKWEGFVEDVEGQYGFKCFHTLKPLTVYNAQEDPTDGNQGKPDIPVTTNEY